ncbi:MAG: hypothetical protein HGA45_07260 [Chloroflexales bacterium]|nr:hypothetical protein [Chloroflexales bacterium]
MASDALLDNTLSQQAHQRLGYVEVERSVHFSTKQHRPLHRLRQALAVGYLAEPVEHEAPLLTRYPYHLVGTL